MTAEWVSAMGTWAGALATFAAVLYALYGGLLTRPVLVVRFTADDLRVQTITKGYESDGPSRWVRINVTCKEGRSSAKKCRAYIVGGKFVGKSSRADGDANFMLRDSRPRPWMNDERGKYLSRDILPGVMHWIDLASCFDGHLPRLSDYPGFGFDHAPGEALVTVQVSAEACTPVLISMRLSWGPDFRSLRAERATLDSDVAKSLGYFTSRYAEYISSPSWRDHRVGARK